MKQPLSHQTLRRIVYFEAIAAAGSIRGAADQLGLSTPVLSEALSDLEQDLGVSLATRSTRKFTLTEAGTHVHRVSQQIVELVRDLPRLGVGETPLTGTLNITLPVELSVIWLPQKLRKFREIAPKVEVSVSATDELETLNTTPIELALRTVYMPSKSHSDGAMSLDLTIVARDMPARRGNTFQIPLIDGQRGRTFSPISRKTGQSETIRFKETLQVNNHLSAIAWAKQGLGAALVIRQSVMQDIEQGHLVEIMPDHSHGTLDMKWVYRDRLPSRNALAFVDIASAA